MTKVEVTDTTTKVEVVSQSEVNVTTEQVVNVIEAVQGISNAMFLSYLALLDSDDITEGTTHLFMTVPERSKLNGIESGAEVNDVDTVNGYIGDVVLDPDDLDDTSTTHKFTSSAEISKLAGIEALADVTDATNVASAGAVMEGDTTTASMSFVIDEDDMSSNSATKIPTQQSVKAYADKRGVLAYDVYDTAGSHTWNKPSGASVVEVFAIGGGGGGGKGAAGAAGTLRHGGGAGGPGGAVIAQFDADDISSSVSVTVGAGGTAGTVSGAFTTGGNGGSSSFGSYVTAGGGAGGPSGGFFIVSENGGSPGSSSLNVSPGGGGMHLGIGFQAPGVDGHIGSGAGGAAIDASNVTSPALQGGNGTKGAGGTAGGSGSAGGNGGDGSATNGGGGGGGGGLASVGGDGGANGGSGGGGGAALSPATAGNGGAGGRGIVIVITYG